MQSAVRRRRRQLPPCCGWSTKLLEWAAILACLLGLSGLAAGAEIGVARDLQKDSLAAKQKNLPIVILFSRADCSWCEQVRRQHLAPLTKGAELPALIRQIDVDTDRRLIDFDGAISSHRRFAKRLKATLTPTVMFFGPDGEALAESIVGYRLADFYGAYLEQAITDSRGKLAGHSDQ